MDGFAALGRLIQSLEHLGSHGSDAVAAKLEDGLGKALENQYEFGADPRGNTWADKADGTASHLDASGTMRRETRAVKGVKGVTVRIPKPAGFHQSGTGRMRARPLVPEGDQLPREWEKAAQEAAASVIREGLK